MLSKTTLTEFMDGTRERKVNLVLRNSLASQLVFVGSPLIMTEAGNFVIGIVLRGRTLKLELVDFNATSKIRSDLTPMTLQIRGSNFGIDGKSGEWTKTEGSAVTFEGQLKLDRHARGVSRNQAFCKTNRFHLHLLYILSLKKKSI